MENTPDNKTIAYRLLDLQGDMSELKKDVKDMTKVLSDLSALSASIKQTQHSLDCAWREIREIQKTCMYRQQFIDKMKKYDDPQDWFSRLITSGVTQGIWIIISVLIAVLITKWVG